MKPTHVFILAGLASLLLSCGKKEESAAVKPGPAPAPAPAAPSPSTTTVSSGATLADDEKKAAPTDATASQTPPSKEPTPPKAEPAHEPVAVTPGATTTNAETEAAKAKLLAQQKSLQEEKDKAVKANDEAKAAEADRQLKDVEKKLAELPRPDLGEGFEAKGVEGGDADAVRSALDKMVEKAPILNPTPPKN